MAQVTKQPLLSNLAELQQAINRLFDPTMGEQEAGLSNVLTSDWVPTIDVKDQGAYFLIQADIPGVELRDIDVSVDNNVLTIRGQKESKVKIEKKNYVRVERVRGNFFRSISLPEVVEAGRITAKFKNGVLEVIAPKNKTGTRKKIKVK